MLFIPKVVSYMLERKLISEVDSQWLQYGLEKRLVTFVFLIPIIILGTIQTNIYMTASFLMAYFYIRSMSNGFHFKTKIMCFIFSLVLEWIFLSVICPRLTAYSSATMFLLSTIFIFLYAPYNHPNMHLSEEELCACRNCLRIRLIVLEILLVIAYLLSMKNIVLGMSAGVTMAALLLCLVYILNWRSLWKTKQGEKQLQTKCYR